MPTQFRIAHLSDLHFSGGSYYKGKHAHSIARLKGVERILRKQDFDRVIVSGDLSDMGDGDSLTRVREWLFGHIELGASDRTGLGLNWSQVGLVPGNHDAYGCRNANSRWKLAQCWQKSLEAFNEVFPDHALDPEDGACRYDWIEKDGRGLFIVYLDTCYLGDPELDERLGAIPIRFIDKIARGSAKRGQAERVHAWCSLGMEGKLTYPQNEQAYIPKEIFQRSLKIVVAHHYLFEPKGAKAEPLLQMKDARAVFGNLAGGDFDLYLCGHKHHPDVREGSYDEFYDRRGKSRHLLNLYRRLIGLGPLPLRDAARGAGMAKSLRMLVLLTAVKEAVMFKKAQNVDELDDNEFDRLLEAMNHALESALENPRAATRELTSFLNRGRINVSEVLDAAELAEIESRLSARLSKEDRQKLKPSALKIQSLMRDLASRSFVQILAASACKETDRLDGTVPWKRRGFNCYDIVADDQGFQLTIQPYEWHIPSEDFRGGLRKTIVFHDAQRAIL